MMTWLIVSSVLAVVFGSAWGIDRMIKRKNLSRKVMYDAYRDKYKTEDWFSDAKAYRRPPPGPGGGIV